MFGATPVTKQPFAILTLLLQKIIETFYFAECIGGFPVLDNKYTNDVEHDDAEFDWGGDEGMGKEHIFCIFIQNIFGLLLLLEGMSHIVVDC